MPLHRLLARLALALLLLLGQQGATLHAFEHLRAGYAAGQDKQLPQHHGCELCASYAQLGSGAPSAPLPPPVVAVVPIPAATADTLAAPAAPRLPYSPRAPPRLA